MKSCLIISLLILTAVLVNSCEKDVFTGPPDEPPPQNGKIFVSSKPAGATIYVDGKNMGLTTPDSIEWLNTGVYSVKLRMDLFRDSVFQLSVKDSQTTSIFIDYYKNPGHYGAVYCNSKPQGASILFNDTLGSFVTPHRFNGLFPGYYKIVYTMPEHRADSAIIPVHGGTMEILNIALVDTSVWVTYNVANSKIPANSLTSLAVDNKNLKWIGTAENGLVSFDGKNWRNFLIGKDISAPDRITEIAVDASGGKWIGTSNGLYFLSGDHLEERSAALPLPYVTALFIDSKGNVWVGTPRGLVKYNGAQWEVFTTKNSGIAADFVTSLAEDLNGTIWIGSNVFGISSFDGSLWRDYDLKKMKLPEEIGNGINSLCVDKSGNIFVAHTSNPQAGATGGLTRFDGTQWTQIFINSIFGVQLTSFFVDKSNYIWISTEAGLAKIDEEGNLLKFYNGMNSLLPSSSVKQVSLDLNGDLWITFGSAGITKFKKGNF